MELLLVFFNYYYIFTNKSLFYKSTKDQSIFFLNLHTSQRSFNWAKAVVFCPLSVDL